MSASQPPLKLICKECSYENEPERVYCHNCGSKLDRSLLPKEDQRKREDPAKAQRRIRRMTNPGVNPVASAIRTFISVLFGAIFVASLVLMAREPADVPKPVSGVLPRLITSELMNVISTPQPSSLILTEQEINAYLGTGKVQKASGLLGVEYKRSAVSLKPGEGRLWVEKALYGYSIYFSTIYRAEVVGGKMKLTNGGGSIGRLPIHPLLMQYIDQVMFRDVFTALKRDYEMLMKAQYVKIEQGRATVVSRGTSAAP